MNGQALKPKRNRGYYTAIIAIAAVMLVTANVWIRSLDEQYRLKVDVTKGQATLLTDSTKTRLNELEQDIFLYYLSSREDEVLTTAELLKNYADASSRIHYIRMDSALAGLFGEDIVGVKSQTVIVSDANVFMDHEPIRYKVIPEELLYANSAPYYNMGGQPVTDLKGFRGQQKIASAIDHLVTGDSKKVKFLAGHLEKQPCMTLIQDITALYYKADEYNYLTADLPLDPAKDTLVVISPRKDLADNEYEGIETFLKNGGKAIFFIDTLSVDEATGNVDYLTEDLDYFNLLLGKYGVLVNNDIVAGGDPSKTYKSLTGLMPSLGDSCGVTMAMDEERSNPVLINASSINVLPHVQDVEITPLLVTDDSCYAKTVDEGLASLRREPDDVSGAFILGALARKHGSAIALYTSSSFVVSEKNYAHKSNAMLFLNTLGDLNQRLDSTSLGIQTIYASDMGYSNNTLSGTQKSFIIVLVTGIIPIGVLIYGVLRCRKRKHL